MTKSTISVIGVGRIGQAITGLAVRQGHPVVLSNSRGPDTLEAVVDEVVRCPAATPPLGPRPRATSASSR